MSSSTKRTETSVVKVGASAPSFLQEYVKANADTSTDDMREYRVVPRVKVIQGMTDAKLKEIFGEGAAIMSPGGIEIARARENFLFVPIYFYAEFVTWRDREDKSSGAVVARSLDKGGEIARKSRDANLRLEEYPGSQNPKKPFNYRHVEHLNFAGLIYGASIDESSPVVLGFSRGEFFTGKNFVSAIMMRKINGTPAPLWAQVWQMRTDTRQRNGNTWWGVDFTNPETPWIREEEMPYMKALHEELSALGKEGRVIVDLSESDDGDAADAETAASFNPSEM